MVVKSLRKRDPLATPHKGIIMSAVVVGVDSSETALAAAKRAAKIAASLGQPLHLVMAVKPGHSTTIKHGGDSFFDDWTQDSKQLLQRIKHDIGMPDATSSIGSKDPVEAICAEAEKVGASLIVVGNRRVQGVKRVLGAVANGVLRHAGCDVLVVQTSSPVANETANGSTSHSISTAKVFRLSSKQELARLDSIATSIQVPAGRELTSEGRHGKEFGVLLDGSATVTVDGEVVATLRAGDHFGEMALLQAAGVGSDLRTATVVADTDLWISVMSVQEFGTLLNEFPDVADQLRRSAAQRATAVNT